MRAPASSFIEPTRWSAPRRSRSTKRAHSPTWDVWSTPTYRQTAAAALDARAPEQFHKAVADAGQELAELERRLPTLSVTLRGASEGDRRVQIHLDGAPVDPALLRGSLPLDPGPHRVELWVEGRLADSKTLTLAEREHPNVDLAVVGATPVVHEGPRPAAAPQVSVQLGGHSWPRTLAFVSLGIAGAGIGTGVVTGLMAAAKHSDAERECPDNRCPAGSAGSRDVDSFRDLRLVSTVGYAVGAVAAVGGVTLLFVAPARDATPTTGALGVWFDARRVGVRGMFW